MDLVFHKILMLTSFGFQRDQMRRTKQLLDEQVDEIRLRRIMESQDLDPREQQLNSGLLKKAETDPAIRAKLQVRTRWYSGIDR